MPVYNKLVRDRIPEIIKNNGKSFRTRQLNKVDYITELKKKAKEELEEYLNSQSDAEAVEELADLLEIIHTLAGQHGASIDQLEEVQRKKREERGGFQEKVFLIDVEEK